MIVVNVTFIRTMYTGFANEVTLTLVAAMMAKIAPRADIKNVTQVSSKGLNQACLIVGNEPMISIVIPARIAIDGELKMYQSNKPIIAPTKQEISKIEKLLSPYLNPKTTIAKHSIEADKESTKAAYCLSLNDAAADIPVNKAQINHDTTLGFVFFLSMSTI